METNDLGKEIDSAFAEIRQTDSLLAPSDAYPFAVGYRAAMAGAVVIPEGVTQVVKLKAGDVLLLMHPGKLRTEAREYLEKSFSDAVGGVRCVILEDGVGFGVIRPPESIV